MAGWTNRGAYQTLGVRFRGQSNPSAYYMALVTATPVPEDADNVLGDLTEIAAGNGYASGGVSLTPGGTDFDVWTEDDANHRALVQIRDVVWTASGGTIPASGGDARYASIDRRQRHRRLARTVPLLGPRRGPAGSRWAKPDRARRRDPTGDRLMNNTPPDTLPRWARIDPNGAVSVDPDAAYPVYFALLGIDLDDADQFWAEVARRCLTADLKTLVGTPLHLRIRDSSHWSLASLPAGGGAALGAATFRSFYGRIKGRALI